MGFIKKNMYTALAKDKETGGHHILRYEYPNHSSFAEDLRMNGYGVTKIWKGDKSDEFVDNWYNHGRLDEKIAANERKREREGW